MKVTLYKSADGALHESFKACVQRDVAIRVVNSVQASKADDKLYDVVNSSSSSTGTILSHDDLPYFIAQNADTLRKILNESLVAKRTRKVKSPHITKSVAVAA